MNNEYIIVNKTLLEKRIEELEVLYKNSEKPSIQGTIYNQLSLELKKILSQSTPLIPEIEKAFDAGVHEDYLDTIGKEDYFSNLKLDI
jgi:hypothetical protein